MKWNRPHRALRLAQVVSERVSKDPGAIHLRHVVACTINVSGLGVVSIKTQAGANPGAAALKTNGIYGMICDGSLLQLL